MFTCMNAPCNTNNPLSHALEETTTTRIIRLCRLTNVCSTFITIIILLSVIFFLLTCRKGKAFFIICKQIDVFFFPFVIISKKRRSITVNLPTAKRGERRSLPPHHYPPKKLTWLLHLNFGIASSLQKVPTERKYLQKHPFQKPSSLYFLPDMSVFPTLHLRPNTPMDYRT